VSAAPVELTKAARRLLVLYREDLEVRFAPLTVLNYTIQVRHLLEWLEGRGLSLAGLREADVRGYQGALFSMRQRNGRPYALASQQVRLLAVKSFTRFLARRHYLLVDPAASLELPRKDRRLVRVVLSVDEVRRVLGAAQGRSPRALRDRAMLEVLYGAALRVSELVKLTPYDVDTENATVRVVLGKGRKDRYVPLVPRAASAVDAYLEHGREALVRTKAPWLFLTYRGRRLDPWTVGEIVRHYAAKAGVGKRVTPHTFRHSIATHLLRGGADIRYIQMLLGHRHLSSTERYTHVALKDLREVVLRAHPRGR
jgi:integrase/recombinase XerD